MKKTLALLTVFSILAAAAPAAVKTACAMPAAASGTALSASHSCCAPAECECTVRVPSPTAAERSIVSQVSAAQVRTIPAVSSTSIPSFSSAERSRPLSFRSPPLYELFSVYRI